MTYYIENDQTGEFYNGETEAYQRELTVICVYEDYDEALKAANIAGLTNYTIRLWN